MKTQLPNSITTIAEAKVFLKELHDNNETYHPEDDATEIYWQTTEVSQAETQQLNKLMSEIYILPGNEGRHHDLEFDPCEYLYDLLDGRE